MSDKDDCPCCDGTGLVPGEYIEDIEPCLTCDGTGKHSLEPYLKPKDMDKVEEFAKELAALCKKYDARIEITYYGCQLEIAVDEDEAILVNEIDKGLHEKHF
jgi:hypothetical protein